MKKYKRLKTFEKSLRQLETIFECEALLAPLSLSLSLSLLSLSLSLSLSLFIYHSISLSTPPRHFWNRVTFFLQA